MRLPLIEIVDVGADVLADVPCQGFWYHVTHERFDNFDFGAESNTFDWNTHLGVHFSRDGKGARDYFGTWRETCRVIKAQLALHKPARYESEHDLDFHALRLLKADGLTLEQLELDEHNVLFDSDWENIRRWFDDYDLDAVLYDEDETRWCRDLVLANHRKPALRRRAADLVLADLSARGFDGIVYGNEIDFACVSAVAFLPEQISILSHDWQP